MEALSPWFDSELTPAREGWYDVRTGAGKEQRAFYGKSGKRTAWWQAAPTEGLNPEPIADVLEWRGLLSPATTQGA
ncbi:hypothetical protein [Niveibacterium sp. SC-1]|uniref:hypothetical protein n=1 Tax=Niveibacterium sp. SC-1 TaxID=3135646 RepID=UPI00311FA4DB